LANSLSSFLVFSKAVCKAFKVTSPLFTFLLAFSFFFSKEETVDLNFSLSLIKSSGLLSFQEETNSNETSGKQRIF